MSDNSNAMWGGRFEKATDPAARAYHSSIGFDIRLWREDIAGSIAHATMLGEEGILEISDAAAIIAGLHNIEADLAAGKLSLDPQAEDIHMAIEAELTRRIGTPGGRLHTGRSRNDQVALDTRLYAKRTALTLAEGVEKLIAACCDVAERHLHAAMPGYTHLQRAQPVTLAHHFMAYAHMLLRDAERLYNAARAADIMPLGSGALAGTTYPLNRERVAELLGFSAISSNSLDAVSDRDFACDYIYAATLCMVHLSRLCEELVLWSSQEFAFVRLDDAFATGSSMMPQKKNPDFAELTRGKTGRVLGDLVALLTTLKNLPLAYNKDMQEDKEALFDAHDTLNAALAVLTPMLASAVFDTVRLADAAAGGFTNATDAADYLVAAGVPFREAHEVVGKLVAHCLTKKCSLLDLSGQEWTAFHPAFAPEKGDVRAALTLAACIARRDLPGGPAPARVAEQIAAARAALRQVQRG